MVDATRDPSRHRIDTEFAHILKDAESGLGSRWLELQLAVNVLMVAHYFTIEVSPADFKFRFNPLPSMKPSKMLRFRIAEQRREMRA